MSLVWLGPLREITATLIEELDFGQRLVRIAGICCRAASARSVGVAIDEGRRGFVIRATASGCTATLDNRPATTASYAAMIKDAASTRAQISRDDNARIAVPMLLAGTAVGALYVEAEVPLTSEVVELLCFAASQLAIAVCDARLVEKRERSDAALRLLADVSMQFTASVAYDQLLSKIGPLTVPAIADWCVVDMEVAGVLRPLASAHVDPDLAPVVRELHREYPGDVRAQRPLAHVLRTKEPLLFSEITEEQLRSYARDEHHLRVLHMLAPQSVMIVPLVARDQSLGVVSFVASRSGRHYDELDLALAVELARCLALALANARLFRDLQDAMRQRAQRDRQLKMVFRHFPGAVWAVDNELKITYTTGRLLDSPELKAETVQGTTVYDVVGTRDPATPAILHHLAALHGEPQSYEDKLRDRWYAVLIDPLRDRDGRIAGAVAAAFDITEKQKFAERLARSERQLWEAQHFAHVGSFEWEINPDVLHWSDELQRIYGFEPGQFAGTFEAFMAMVPVDEQPATKEIIFSAFARMAPFTYDHRIQRTDGTIRVLRSTGGVVKDANGTPIRMVGTCWDVTDQVELLERLEHETERTRQALKARDEFLSIAAHEIRGPINSIHLAIQAMRQGNISTDSMPRFLDIIERQDRRLAEFVEELLDVGRIRAGRFEIDREHVKLDDVVHDAVERVTPDLSRSGSSLSVQVDGPIEGEWDRSRLDQVVFNLLQNAIKFGAGKPIELAVRAHNSRATIAITDHGPGITPEVQARLFQPFERGVSVRHYGGLGLGLHIVKTIVEALGGSVMVESEPGHGATFMVDLPKHARRANNAHHGS